MTDLRLDSVRKVYPGGVVGVDDVSLHIQHGEFLVLLGPSGCGKSTLLQIIAGLEAQTSGQVHFGDRRVDGLPANKRDVAMVFQSYALYPNMSVYKNIAFGLRMRKTAKDETDRKVREAAERLGLTDVLKRRPAQLSGGQRQRVALGRAIVRDPRVFLLDEPLSNVDAKLRTDMRIELKDLHQKLNTTFVYVTHDQAEAMSLGDYIAVMDHGALRQFGTPMDIYNRPQNLFVAGFVGSPAMNLVEGTLDVGNTATFHSSGVRCEWDKQEVGDTVTNGNSVVVGFRPGDAQVLPADNSGPVPTLTGEVSFLEPLGSDLLITLQCQSRRLIIRVDPSFSVRPGDTLAVHIPKNRLHLFDAATGNRVDTHISQPDSATQRTVAATRS